ncbi:MAG: hypothetical protein M3405_17470 [Acidobacteriota bacterium]|jgi:hypothetical protein|nr:hypothetical protein [Acidobacteriota bacterium]
MAISRKPKTEKRVVKEKEIDALINKGGSPASDNKEKSIEKPILLRIPADTLEKVDEVVKSKQIKTPRHTWLLEAVFEKLNRESQY